MPETSNKIETDDSVSNEIKTDDSASNIIENDDSDSASKKVETDVSALTKTDTVPVQNGSNCANCKCVCGSEFEELKIEVENLKSWKANQQQFQDLISIWKEEVDRWILSFRGTIKANGNETNVLSQQKDSVALLKADKSTKVSLNSSPNLKNESELILVQNNNKKSTEKFIDEDEGDDIGREPEEGADIIIENNEVLVDPGPAENVEITPDIFGHFLLDGADDDEGHSVENSIESCEESIAEDEEIPESTARRKRRKRDDSDSEVYTVTSSSDSEEFSTDEEYMSQKKRGRGRPAVSQNSKNSNQAGAIRISKKTGSELAELENRRELIQHITKRQGNIWECNVCGFMLSSFENMLLHIKYNHSTSTHTCPHCRVVVLCRSPKDAILHQASCKMRPSTSSTLITPPVKNATTNNQITLTKRQQEEAVSARVNQFVADLMEPSTSSKSSHGKKTDQPAVVTISSDEET